MVLQLKNLMELFKLEVPQTLTMCSTMVPKIPQLKKLKPRVTPEIIVEHVSKAFNAEVTKIQQKGLKRNKAREVAIYLGRELSRISCNELGDFFGGVSGALITMMNRRITEEIDKNRLLKNKIEKIKEQIFNI